MKSTTENPMQNQSFEDLEKGFNFHTGRRRGEDFLNIIKSEVRSDHVVLDVGCGRGICRSLPAQKEVAEACGSFWGVEPDPGVELEAGLFQRSWRSNLEDADIPALSVDIVYSAMVLEHVADPKAFLGKIYDILKPGGKFLAVTISGYSYLGMATLVTEKLKIQDRVLTMLVGSESVESYHYPAVYRMNREASLKKQCEEIGFKSVRFAYTDNNDALVYFPRGLVWIGKAMDGLKKAAKRKALLNNMYIVFEK